MNIGYYVDTTHKKPSGNEPEGIYLFTYESVISPRFPVQSVRQD
jgi:hypothetical protein